MPDSISVEILQLILKEQSVWIDQLKARVDVLEKEVRTLGEKVAFPLRYDPPIPTGEPEF